ncbi:MAG: HIT family protein [Patescibacteria group bacterium]
MKKDLVIFETTHWKIILNVEDQTYLGRSVVVCKRAAATLSDLTDAEWSDFHEVVKKFEAAATKAFDATMFNWTCLMNEAYRHDPPDPRVHWHVRPRYKKAVTFAGQEFTDDKFGHHYDRKTSLSVTAETAGKISEAIRNDL